MQDFNFFSSFEKVKREQKKKTRRTIGVVVGVVLLVVLFYGVMGLRMYLYSNDIKNGETYLNSPEVKPKLTELQAKKNATTDLKKYSTEIGKAIQRIAVTDIVTSEFMDTIEKTFPATVSLTYLQLKGHQLTLEGNIPTWTPAAELTHELEKTGLFTRVQVNSINKEKDTAIYHFGITCDLKEVAVK